MQREERTVTHKLGVPRSGVHSGALNIVYKPAVCHKTKIVAFLEPV